MKNRFNIIMGVNAGYFHENSTSVNFGTLYQEKAEKFFAETGIYVSAIIGEKKVVYSPNWGCPVGGEVIFEISGTHNPNFSDYNQYRMVVEALFKELALELGQKTFTLEWCESELNYIQL